jgi:CHASE3 domain sensor protein
MKPTIRNKLLAGFSGVLLLMAVVAGIGIYSVFKLRHSAQDATRIGGQLNSVALEIQVHNLEAQRRIKGYLADVKKIGAQQARDTYLDEASFEIHEIASLADRAVRIAPDAEKRAKFQKIASSVGAYEKAVTQAVEAAEKEIR